MKKFLNLVINECTKQFKKRSFLILIIILAVICVGATVLDKVMEDKYKNSYSFSKNTAEHLKSAEEYLNRSKDELAKTPASEIKQIHAMKLNISDTEANIEGQKLKLKYNIDYEDWRNQSLGHFTECTMAKKSIQEGIFDADSDKFLAISAQMPDGTSQEQIAWCEKEIAKSIKAIEENDYKSFSAEQLKKAEITYNQAKNEYDAEKQKYDATPEVQRNSGDLIAKKDVFLKAKISCDIAKARVDYDIIYDNENPYNKMLMDLENLSTILNKPLISKKDYDGEKLRNGALPDKYEVYVERFNQSNEKTEIEVNKLKYGIEHKIPTYEATSTTRNSVNFIFSFAMFITLIAAIIAGGIVSTEFSKGTVRLLLTRPVSRTKILMSKYITSVIISLILLIVAFLSITISSFCLYGAGDLGVPMLQAKDSVGNVIKEVPYMLWILPKLASGFISLLFITTVSFTLSTLTKNTAIATGISVAISLGSQIITSLMLMKPAFAKVVGYTPIPYMDLFQYGVGNSNMGYAVQEFYIFFNLNYGTLMLLALTVILVAISIITFKKRDIMN